MMWFDKNAKTTFRDKVIGGVAFFREKYKYDGLVQVRVRVMQDCEKIPNVEIAQMNEVVLDNFWIGVDKGDFRKKEEQNDEKE